MGIPLVEWWKAQPPSFLILRSPRYVAFYADQVLLATTLQPLVVQLSGSLAHGAKLIDQFCHQEPTPLTMAGV